MVLVLESLIVGITQVIRVEGFSELSLVFKGHGLRLGCQGLVKPFFGWFITVIASAKDVTFLHAGAPFPGNTVRRSLFKELKGAGCRFLAKGIPAGEVLPDDDTAAADGSNRSRK